jgi:hypothetical protein
LTKIIRRHQAIDEGCRLEFKNKLWTVHSASNMMNKKMNKGRILKIKENFEEEIFILEPMSFPVRELNKF